MCIVKVGKDNVLFVPMRIFVFELPPGQHLGEAEEYEGGEGVCGFSAVEADSETATLPVVASGGHVVVISAFFHFTMRI